MLLASLPGQGAGAWVVVNILEIRSGFDTRSISLTNIAALSREALAASGIGSKFSLFSAGYSDKLIFSVLPQVTHIYYLTFGENANFLVHYQLHSCLCMSHSPLHAEMLSMYTALPKFLIAHQLLPPVAGQDRALPQVTSCPYRIAQPLITASCCEQPYDTRQGYR